MGFFCGKERTSFHHWGAFKGSARFPQSHALFLIMEKLTLRKLSENEWLWGALLVGEIKEIERRHIFEARWQQRFFSPWTVSNSASAPFVELSMYECAATDGSSVRSQCKVYTQFPNLAEKLSRPEGAHKRARENLGCATFDVVQPKGVDALPRAESTKVIQALNSRCTITCTWFSRTKAFSARYSVLTIDSFGRGLGGPEVLPWPSTGTWKTSIWPRDLWVTNAGWVTSIMNIWLIWMVQKVTLENLLKGNVWVAGLLIAQQNLVGLAASPLWTKNRGKWFFSDSYKINCEKFHFCCHIK